MYERFFDMRERPFADRLDTRAFYSTPDREEALAALECAATFAAGHVLIIGEAGIGKTLLVRMFVSRLAQAERAIILTPTVDGGLIHETCRKLNIGASGRGGAGRLFSRLQRQLAKLAMDGQRSILVIDQAERLTIDQLMEIEQLAELRSGEERLLSIVLVGQPEVTNLLAQPELRRLRQLFLSAQALRELSADAVAGYVHRAVEAVGGTNHQLFSANALALLHTASGGVPRIINRLADAALTAAYGAGQAQIDMNIMEEIAPGTAGGALPSGVNDESHMRNTLDTTSEMVAGECESLEPFDWSALPAPAARAILYPPWESEDVRSGRRMGWNTVDDEEETMVSIACAATGQPEEPAATARSIEPSVPPRPQDNTYREYAAPSADLLERLERAVSKFGQALPEIIARPTHEPHALPLSNGMESPAFAAAENRLRTLMTQAEKRVTELELRAARLVKPLEQVELRRGQIERACDSAQRMEARLAGFAEQIARAACELQERSAVLAADCESGDAARERLAELIAGASAAVMDLEARFELNRQNEQELESRIEEARRGLARSVREARETHATMDELVVQASSDHARATSRTESLRRELQEMVGRVSESIQQQQECMGRELRASMEKVVQAQGAEFQAYMETRQRLRAEEEEQLRIQRELLLRDIESMRLEAVASVQREFEQHQFAWREERDAASKHHQAELESAGAAFQKLQIRSAELVTEAREQIALLTEQQRAELVAARDDVAGQVNESREEFENLYETNVCKFEQLKEQHDALSCSINSNIDALQQRKQSLEHEVTAISAQLGEISTSLDRTLRQREGVMRGLTQAQKNMDLLTDRGTEIRTQLTEALRECEAGVHSAKATCGQLESRQQASAQLLVDIGVHCERAQALQEQLPRGEALAGRLDEQLSTALPIVQKLPDLVETGRRGAETLAMMNADAAQHITRLESHRAAATSANRQLSDATIAAHDLMEEMRRTSSETRESLTTSQAQSVELRDSLADQMGRVMDMMKQLSTATQGGVATAKQLDMLRQAAAEESTALNEYAARAENALKDLWEHTTSAETAIGQLASMQSAVSLAESTASQLRTTVETARHLQEALTATSDVAIEHQESLATWCATAGELTQSGDTLAQRLQVEAERVAQTLQSVSEATTGHEESLQQYIEQSAQIAQTLTTMHEQLNRMDSEMNSAMSRPMDVLQSAQEQTTQLESVCAAVRKVFGNLAQTSLQARKDIQAFEARSSDAATRSAKLTEETNRASATLQQWVQEAIHVQSRLERTLAQSPSLAQTHPGEVLKSVSRLAKPIAGPGPMAAAKADSGLAKEDASTAGPDNQAMEIAGILREVRSARPSQK